MKTDMWKKQFDVVSIHFISIFHAIYVMQSDEFYFPLDELLYTFR